MNKSVQIIIFSSALVCGVFLSFTQAQEKILAIDTEALCVASSCHDNMGKKKFVHGVGVDGKHCKKCHKVVTDGQHVFSRPEKLIEVCAQCHSGKYLAPSDIEGAPPIVLLEVDVFEEGKVTKFHPPFIEGKCTECHDAHESDYYMQLKGRYPGTFYAVFSIDGYGLCMRCHKDLEKALTEPRTLTHTGFRNGNLNLHFRHVNRKKGRTCGICHHHHGSENPMLIKPQFLFGEVVNSLKYEKTDTGGRCAVSCHMDVTYDRYEPVENIMKTSPRLGKDATESELRLSREMDLKKEKEKQEEARKKDQLEKQEELEKKGM